MRISRTGIALVIISAAAALLAASFPAGGMTLPSGPSAPGSPQMFFDQNMFSSGMTVNMPPFSTSLGNTPAQASNTAPNYAFLNEALGMVPAGDSQTATQMDAIRQMQQGYRPNYGTTTASSWMDQFTQPSAINGDNNPAENAYAALIMKVPNMKNIFAS